MSPEQDLTLIDAYLREELPDDERAVIAQRLASDPVFRELYDFTLAVQRAAQQVERQRIKAMLQSFEAEQPAAEDEARIIPFDSYSSVTPGQKQEEQAEQLPSNNLNTEAKTRRLEEPRHFRWPFATVGIAASVIGALLVWQPTRSSNDDLFATYAGTTMSTATLPGTAPGGETGTRGSDNTLPGFTTIEAEELTKAVNAIQSKEFEQAKPLLQGLIKTKGRMPMLVQPLAVAQLNSNEVAQAVSNLESLQNIPASPLRDQVSYDLALGYIKLGKLSQARTILQSLEAGSSKYAAPAASVRSKMRWWF